jgi:transposase-like protein
MRNILAKVPHKEKRRFAAHLKQIWLQPDPKSARRMADELARDYEDRFADAIRCLEDGLEDSLQFYSFPEIDPKKISSTNMSERTIREVRRRSRVIGVFPSVESWVRLETCYLMEYSEDWRSDRSYIKREKVQEVLEHSRSFLTAQAAS